MSYVVAFVRSRRLWRMVAVALGLYLLIFKVLGPLSVTWLIPSDGPSRFHWPDLPYFYSHTRDAPDGKNREELIVVPTRQLTSKEIEQLNGGQGQPGEGAAKAPAK